MKPQAKMVWPIVMLAALTVVFFVGGIYLDTDAASHGLKGALKAQPNATPEQIKDMLAFQSDRIKSIQQDAAAAYDISKVALGALVSSVAHLISSSANQPSPLESGS